MLHMYSQHDLLICASSGAARCDSHGASRAVPCMLGRGWAYTVEGRGWMGRGCRQECLDGRVEVELDGWMDKEAGMHRQGR